MVILDTSDFPIVRMSEEAAERDWEPQLDALLGRQEPFVLVSGADGATVNHEEIPGDRKRRALWLKRNKIALLQWCAGAVLIQPNKTLALATKAAAFALQKAFGFSIHVANSAAGADEQARALLRSQ